MMQHQAPALTGGGWLLKLLVIILLFISVPALAKSKYEYLKVAGGDEYNVAPYTRTLEDASHEWTIDDITRPDVERLFTPNASEYLNYGVSTNHHWIRVEIRHIDKKGLYPERAQWMLDIGRSQLDVAELYIRQPDGHFETLRSDRRILYADRPVRSVNSVFPVTTARNVPLTLYIKVANKNSTYLPIHLRSAANYVQKTSQEEFLYGIFFGGMTIIIIYNLFLFISIRDYTYLYYVFYLAPVTFFEFIDIGHGVIPFERYPQVFNKDHIPFSIWIAFLFGLLFIERFLDLPRRSPLIHSFFKPMYVFILAASLINYMIPYQDALMFTAYFCGTGSTVISILGIYAWKRWHDTNALLMAFAWSFSVFGFLVYGAMAVGLIAATPQTTGILPIGTWLEAVTLAFALGERIKRTQKRTIWAKHVAMEQLGRYRSLFENASEGIYQLSLQGKFLGANSAMATILGFSSKETMLEAGRSAIAMLFNNAGKQWRDLLQTRNLRSEIVYPGPDGETHYAMHSAQLIRNHQGEPSHIEGVLVDLTERRQNENAQRARLKERHEKELAKSATDSKSVFLKNMSYQIRTPLNAIIGYSECLRDSNMESTSRQVAVSSVIRNSQTLLQLVNDILDFSKMEAGKMAVEYLDIDLMALVRQVQTRFEGMAREKGLSFRVDCRFPLPARIISDPTRIRQILQNLCSNAIKYTQHGSVKLIIHWDGIQQQLCFDVEDSGIGLNPDEIRQLSGESPPEMTQGSAMSGGLGLSLTGKLTRMLGGKLSIESRKGYGSRFSASIACRIAGKSDWIKNAQAPEAAATATKSVPSLGGHVLLAEDNAVNQKLISRLIGKTGATVTLAENGQLALDEAIARSFDLVLMDINMPVMDGLTATRRLRSTGYAGPIYALTAENGVEEIQACIDAGCVGHLNKPIDVAVFYATLGQHLPAADALSAAENQQ